MLPPGVGSPMKRSGVHNDEQSKDRCTQRAAGDGGRREPGHAFTRVLTQYRPGSESERHDGSRLGTLYPSSPVLQVPGIAATRGDRVIELIGKKLGAADRDARQTALPAT